MVGQDAKGVALCKMVLPAGHKNSVDKGALDGDSDGLMGTDDKSVSADSTCTHEYVDKVVEDF